MVASALPIMSNDGRSSCFTFKHQVASCCNAGQQRCQEAGACASKETTVKCSSSQQKPQDKPTPHLELFRRALWELRLLVQLAHVADNLLLLQGPPVALALQHSQETSWDGTLVGTSSAGLGKI